MGELVENQEFGPQFERCGEVEIFERRLADLDAARRNAR
jgi:hypothetical protein